MELEDAPDIVDTPDAAPDTNDAPESSEDTYEEPVSDLRAALDAAVEEHDPDDDGDPAATSGDPAPESATSGDPAATPADGAAPEPKRPVKTAKPPVGWDSNARGEWDKIPDAAKHAIAERERNMNMTLQQTADARKVAKAFGEVMTSHRPTLEAMGFRDPLQGLNQVLSNISVLKNGTPEQRAQSTANLIRAFGVDVEQLDNVLAQSGVPTNNNNAQIEQLLDQRLQPVNSLMQQLETAKYQQQQQAQHAVASDVQSFVDSKPYGADLRMDMADILDMAASRGQKMTLDQAYERACVMHPHIRESIVAQERESQLAKARKNTQAKRYAASSVSGNPAGGGVPRKPDSITDALNDAWDLHNGSM